MTAHYDYLKHTQEETATLREVVENERLLNPLNTSIDYACKYTKRIQELLIILKQTCLCINDLGRTFTLVENVCPLTRITTTAIVPLRKPIPLESNTSTPVVTLVYSRIPKEARNKVPVSNSKINKSLSANKKEPNKSWGSTISNVPSSSIVKCRNNSFLQQSVPSFDQLFEINELKIRSQEKDTIIMKLKERIKSLCGNLKEEKIKQELEEIETINVEIDHRVTKLVTENEHLKQTYKQLYDSIKSSRVRSKEQCDDLIKQVNIKSAKNSDVNDSLQEKALIITALKDTLSKLKGKTIVDEAVTLHPIDPELLRIDVTSISTNIQTKFTS
nr:hypothetical protein [Tanacetum cinerariifolium]